MKNQSSMLNGAMVTLTLMGAVIWFSFEFTSTPKVLILKTAASLSIFMAFMSFGMAFRARSRQMRKVSMLSGVLGLCSTGYALSILSQ